MTNLINHSVMKKEITILRANNPQHIYTLNCGISSIAAKPADNIAIIKRLTDVLNFMFWVLLKKLMNDTTKTMINMNIPNISIRMFELTVCAIVNKLVPSIAVRLYHILFYSPKYKV